MGWLDRLGPLSFGTGKARGWDALPSVPEQKAVPPPPWAQTDTGVAFKVGMLIHGPGATEMLAGGRGGAGNSAVVACMAAITNAYPEAPLRVWKLQPGERTQLPDHPFAKFLNNPNPFLPAEVLSAYVQWCKRIDGNAYLHKIRSGNELTGNVVELWPISPTRIEVRTTRDSNDFITTYRYHLRPGKFEDIDPVNMIHFRVGLDDRDHRVGLSPLKSLLREISTDDHASAFSDALLANFAVPGLVAQMPAGVKLTLEAAEEMKAKLSSRYGGDNRGSAGVLDNGATLTTVGWSPEQLDMKVLHRVPEERISAVLQVPAIVAGLGAGLDRSTFSNVREAREMFTEMNLVPSWRADAAVLNAQLKPDFVSDPTIVAEFDLTEVRALQDDQNAKATRIDTLVRGGQLTLDEGRAEMGFDALPDGAGDVLLLPGAWAPTPPSHLAALAKEPPPDPNAQPVPPPNIVTLPPPDQQRALPPPKARHLHSVENKALSDAEIIARYEAGLGPLEADLADELLGAFEDMLQDVASRAMSSLKAIGVGGNPHVQNGRWDGASSVVIDEVKADAISGLVTAADHADVKRLLRSFVLKGLRQAAEDLSPLTDGTVRITRSSQAYKTAVAEMESRLPGIIATTDADFSRLIARLERRPGSVPLADVRAALTTYVEDTYPGRSSAIARTELGYAHAAGVIEVARRSGLASRVHVHDGDGDSACIARNGTTATLEQAQSIGLLHPNCQLRLIPIVEAA